MDEEIRQYIERAMDEMIEEKGNLLGVIAPFLNPLQIKSAREFGLGYMIGGLKVLGSSFITVKEIQTGQMRRLSNEDKLEIQNMITERLVNIRERELKEN